MVTGTAKDQAWHGIPRAEIPWYPTVDSDACIGCSLCYVSCGRGVYAIEEHQAIVQNPYSCMVGCSTCATVCPVEAITFPSRDIIWKLEREHKIFKAVRKEAEQKKEKADVLAARAAAQEKVAQLSTRERIEVAGEFGEKRFLVQLRDFVQDRPCDVVNVKLEVPTVKAVQEQAPAFMAFEVTSTEQEDIGLFLTELRALIRENGLILVSETKL